MANYDRANHDRDERAFDGGEDDDGTEGTHLPVLIIAAILVLAAFVGVVWLAYVQGVARGRSDGPVRVAATEPVKTAGDNGIKVYQQPAGTDEEMETPAAPVAVAPKPSPLSTPAPAAAPAPVQAPPQAEPQATKPPAQLGIARPAEKEPVAETPAALPKAVPPKAAPPPPKPVEIAKPATGRFLLQIGAFKSEDEARAAWKAYAAKHATLLNGFGPDIQRADLGDKGVWYRLRISSFSDKEAATGLCDRLKTQGGACFLAR